MSKQASRVGVRNDQVDIYGRVNINLPLIDDLATFLPYHSELNVYKNGTEQLLPVNTSEPTTSPVLADIRYPTGIWRNGQYFTYRESPTEATGKARIKSIKGNTLVWNQLVQNGNFADTTGWSSTRGTQTVSSNILTYTITEVSNVPTGNRIQRTCTLTNHKYLVKVDVFCGYANQMYVSSSSSTNSRAFENKTIANQWTTLYAYWTRTDTTYSDLWIGFNCNGWSVGDEIKIRNLQVFDLTVNNYNTFTFDEFRSLFPLSYYAYNTGSLLNFNGTGIKTVGFNQWDEEWEVGSINGANGNNASANDRIRSKNYICVFPNTRYYIKGTIDLFYYDVNKAYIGNVTNVSNRTLTTAENCQYIRFRTSTSYGTTYKNDICINISDTTKNGTYEPYTTSTTSLPISTYFPTGMKSAGVVYDELSDKAITRIGTVDLGTLTWSYLSGETALRFFATLPSDAINVNASDVANAITSKYSVTSWNNVAPNVSLDKMFALTSTYITIRDTSYTDVTTFKQMLIDNNVKLYYELAEYTEESTLDLE